jgi:hypothetical protein
MGLGIGVVAHQERLHLSFRYRHPLMSRAAMARFAEIFAHALDARAFSDPCP